VPLLHFNESAQVANPNGGLDPYCFVQDSSAVPEMQESVLHLAVEESGAGRLVVI
jgi:hypothetical protein